MASPHTSPRARKYLRRLLYGRAPTATLENHLLVIANIFIIILALLSLIITLPATVRYVEFSFGLFFTIEYILRFFLSRRKRRFLLRLVNVLDLFTIVSLLLTPAAPNLAFLRTLRLIQLLRIYKFFAHRFNEHNAFIYRNIEIATAATHVITFLLVMSGIVYVTQINQGAAITSYVDALYFTMATATTTGFGDIVLAGVSGKILSMFIMLFGVTLFFQLVKTIFSPRWLYTVCPGCSHGRHLRDAHYCMRCGHRIKNKFYLSQRLDKNDF